MVWPAYKAKEKSSICRMYAQMYVYRIFMEIPTRQSCNIPLLQWSALSPDLHPMEDFWGILSGKIFGATKQYKTLIPLNPFDPIALA